MSNEQCIGFDINENIIDFIYQNMQASLDKTHFGVCDNTNHTQTQIKRHFKVRLKEIIVKNIKGSRGKLTSDDI